MTKNLICPLPKTMGAVAKSNGINYTQIINEFQQPMQENHCFCNAQIVADGQIHRFHIQGDKPGSKNGWYVLHLYPIPCGVFGDWKNDINVSWKHQQYCSLPPQQKAEIDAQIKAKQLEQECLQQEEHRKAKKTAEQLWEKARLAATNHPYLRLKQVHAYGIKQGRKSLIVPIVNSKNEIQSLQFIDEKGHKKFLSGGELKDNYFAIGGITNKIFICEGYATGATIHEATSCYVIVAFNAGNLLPVAQQIKEQYPNHDIIIAADNDQWTVGNPGITKAAAAASAIAAQLAVPCFAGLDIHSSKPTDFNDLKCLVGLDEVKKQLSNPPEIILENLSDHGSIIAHLASLAPIAYDQAREAHAKKLNIRVTTLDEEVEKRRKISVIDQPVVTSWPELITGDSLLTELTAVLQKHVVLNDDQAISISLWIIFTYCIDAMNVAPILNISSPQKRCGKSTLLSLLEMLVNKPLLASNITPAAIYRTIDCYQHTLLLDEVDTFMKKENFELRGIINSGHTRSTAFVIRTIGDKHEPKRFSTWGAKCLAGIGHLSDTLRDRSIIIKLQRKLPHEKVERLRYADRSLFAILQQKCLRFASDNLGAIRKIKPIIPQELNDRDADNWEPLLIIADLSGEKWLEQARKAALSLSVIVHETDLSEELLRDIWHIFQEKKVDRLSSAELLESLCANPESPWVTYNRGLPISLRQLSQQLKGFAIGSKNYRFADGKTLKGYGLDILAEVFSRYLSDYPSNEKDRNFAATGATAMKI